MDETQRELQRFNTDLKRFNQTMKAASSALHRSHESVAPIWNDSFRRQYDRRWNDFGKHMSDYLQREAGRYESFMSTKIQQIGRYLNG